MFLDLLQNREFLQELLLVLLPLATGLLGISPLQVSAEGLLQHALPFYGAQLLLARWISRQSRTALLPELYRWIFLVPLAGAVLATLAGRPQPFRVTPKEQPGDRGARVPAAVLLALIVPPTIFLVQTSFHETMPDGSFGALTLRYYVNLVSNPRLLANLGNNVVYALGAAAVALTIGTALAWIARWGMKAAVPSR